MPKITVIMPSLNVVQYIRPCMESVLAQTLQDMEILAIDAGSDDGTLEILQEYAEMDRRVHVIHSDKKSYGYQLNRGIALAQGEYVAIVETDDIIASDMYEILYGTAIKTDADYVRGNSVWFLEVKKGIFWFSPMGVPLPDSSKVGQVVEPRKMPELVWIDNYLWTGIYKRQFIKKIVLNETPGAAYQDIGFLYQVHSSAQKAVYLEQIFYQYRQDNGKASSYNPKGFRYLVQEYAYVDKLTQGKTREWVSAAYQKMWGQCFRRFQIMAASGSFWTEAAEDIGILCDRLRKAVENGILQPADMESQWWELLQLFFQGAEKVYDYCEREYQTKAAPLRAVYDKIGNRQTVIFGCGKYGRYFHALLENRQHGLAAAYCDNNSVLWHTEVQGMEVLSPREALQHYPEAVYVIANLKSADAIKGQLLDMGILEKRICVFQEDVDLLMFQ